jgi:RsiW-degrading membrane proteinase PrsW (M82 family)
VTGRLALAGALAVLPVLVLISWFARRNTRRDVPLALLGTFVLGFLAAFPAMALVALASLTSISSPWLAAAVGAFALTAIPEEVLKLLVVQVYSARRPGLRDATDGLVYGITAALGFGALENALYVTQGGWLAAVLRAVTAVPINAATGAMLGYGVARAHLTPDDRGVLSRCLTAAILVHGTYDFALIATALTPRMGTAAGIGRVLFPVVACAALMGAVGWVVHTARRLRRATSLRSSPADSTPDR